MPIVFRYHVAKLILMGLALMSMQPGALAQNVPEAAVLPVPTSLPWKFAKPVRLRSTEGPVAVEAPGFAAPTWHDVNGDGKMDLVVGQFRDGKMQVYKGTGKDALSAPEWLLVDGKPAEVPGVW